MTKTAPAPRRSPHRSICRALGTLLVLYGACGTSGAANGTGDGGHAGAGGGCELVTKKNEPILVDCAEKVVLTDAGNGFRPQPPAGSECQGEASYTLTLSTRNLAWSVCVANATTPWKVESGARVITQDEYASAHSALAAVKVWSGTSGCGADKSTLTIDITTKQGTKRYTDSFYSCSDPKALYVDNIDAAYMAVATLAHP